MKINNYMEKLYYKTTGWNNEDCIDPCKFKDKPSKGTMVGSASCQDCIACYGWDREECWVKCLNNALQNQNVHVELAE